jgi:DNA-binding transcriptional ArsR family regulator
MSNKLVNLAWRQKLPTATKIVLVALADRANSLGECWPSRELLVEMTGLSRAAVSEHLSWLKKDGYLTQKLRRQQSAVYTVVADRLNAALDVQLLDSLALDVQENDILNQDVQELDSLKEKPPAPSADSSKKAANQDVQQDDISAQDDPILDVQELDIPKENPQLKDTRRTFDERDNSEARKLCERLVELLVERDCRRPRITETWLTAARRLLVKDERPFSEALAVLEWSQQDDFWQDNIMSMPTFRKKYDSLRGKAAKEHALTPSVRKPSTSSEAQAWLKDQWRSATTDNIELFTGIRWPVPDLPLNVTGAAASEKFYLDNRRAWIADNHELIISKIVGADAA